MQYFWTPAIHVSVYLSLLYNDYLDLLTFGIFFVLFFLLIFCSLDLVLLFNLSIIIICLLNLINLSKILLFFLFLNLNLFYLRFNFISLFLLNSLCFNSLLNLSLDSPTLVLWWFFNLFFRMDIYFFWFLNLSRLTFFHAFLCIFTLFLFIRLI